MSDAILGPPISSWATVKANLENMGAHPLGLDTVAPTIWDVAWDHGINPEGMIAQSYKETGGWHFEGRVEPWFYNPAGIKVRHDGFVQELLGVVDPDHPLVHQMFPNWPCGITAHAQRLLDYCLAPINGVIVDPRHGFGNRGITLWSELGGRWAKDPDYGNSILDIRSRLVA